jgi:lipoprotein-releasing system permease protein
MLRLIGFVAWRYLRSRREEGFISLIAWLSFIGIMLGVATLIIVMSVMNGFHSELLNRILGINGHMEIRSVTGHLQNFDEIAGKVRPHKNILDVSPLIEGQVMATAHGVSTGVLVRGMRVKDIERRKIFRGKIIDGALEDLDEEGVMLGKRLADRLGLGIGDRITLISPEGNVTAFGTVPRTKPYVVSAIFEVGLFEYDNNFIYMNLKAAQLYFKRYNAVDQLEIVTKKPDIVDQMRQELADLAGIRLHIRDWKQMHSSLSSALVVERNVMFIILTLIILVAALNIISSMIMLVNSKGRDIGILRTMGATRRFVMGVFFWSGASIGLVGTAVGAVIGVVLARNIEAIRQWLQDVANIQIFPPDIYHLSQLPSELHASQVLMVVGMAIGLTFLATLYPAWRAARMNPVEALRYE